MRVFRRRSALFFALGMIASVPARAHVKWFADYDLEARPRALAEVASTPFWMLIAISLLLLWFFCHLERTKVGGALLAAIDELSAAIRGRTEDLFRSVTAAFFISLWVAGGIILTPELRTELEFVPWLQAAIAAGMFWRASLPLSALGILFLFILGIVRYGAFHMMDYPIFLGAAAYLAAVGLQRSPFGTPLDLARWGASITLMWASVEKWAYPSWTFPLLRIHPTLDLGFEPSFFMTAAGVVEFALAFGLLWTPLVRRLAAIVLSGMFISGVFAFGKIDAIGHMMIVMILFVIAAENEPAPVRRPVLAPAYCCVALGGFILAYYGLHALMFRSLTS